MSVTVLTTEGLSEIPRPKWLIEDFVAEKSTTMLYGPWGLGKSFLALDLALTASTGTDWHGRKVRKPLKTMFIVAEGAAWWYRRLLAYERNRGGIDPEMLLWVPQPVNLYDGNSSEFKDIEAAIVEHKPDVLVVDTWVRCSAAYGMSENDATDVAIAYKNIDYLRDKYDVAPLIVHHPTKAGGSRGSGNHEASVERDIELRAVEGNDKLFDVVDKKGNHTEAFTTFRMAFESVDLSDLLDADDEDELEYLGSAVVQYDGYAPTDKGKNVDEALWKALDPLMEMGETWSPKRMEELGVVPAGSIDKALKGMILNGNIIKASRGSYIRTHK